MKKVLKYGVIASLCFMAAGLVFLGIGLLSGGTISYVLDLEEHKVITRDSEEAKYVEKTLDVDAFSKLQLNANTADVKIQRGEKYQVSYCMQEADAPSVEVKDQKLMINGKDYGSFRMNIRFEFFQWELPFDESKKDSIIVTIPENAEISEAGIKVEAGEIQLENVKFETADIHADYGDIEISDFISNHAEISENSGDITLKNVQMKESNITNEYGKITVEKGSGEKAVLTLNSGNCSINDMELDDLQVSNEYGDIEIANSTADTSKIDSDSGAIRIENCKGEKTELEAEYGDVAIVKSALEHIQATCDSGTVDIDLLGKISEYDLNLAADCGEININGEENSGKYKNVSNREKSIDVKNEYGDIRVSTKE